jgi:hypothetical protein
MKTGDSSTRMQRMLDGDLSAEELPLLEKELLGNPKARQAWIHMARIHSALETHFSSQKLLESVVPITRVLDLQRQRIIRTSAFAAAALVILSAIFLWLTDAPRAEKLATLQVTADASFTLTHPKKKNLPGDSSMIPGSRVVLTRGTMEANLASGVRAILRGPCEFVLHSDEHAAMSSGSAWFEVPGQAVGFTVETPNSRIVDLGTAFGVITRSGIDELHVTKGSVKLAAHKPGFSPEIVHAGEARHIAPSKNPATIPLDEDAFLTKLPGSRTIPLANASFEADRNPHPEGEFRHGQARSFGGQLSGWTILSGNENMTHVGWYGLHSDSLHPVSKDEPSQALSLINGASVYNLAHTRWSDLKPGDTLTLRAALGMREPRELPLDWNEETFLGLTAGKPSAPKPGDSVAWTGYIKNNPATGDQSGDGTLSEVTLHHEVTKADVKRPGRIGILIASSGSGGKIPIRNQAFFDNIRLHVTNAR